jgi:homoserine/homoserine lactone efflux protein
MLILVPGPAAITVAAQGAAFGSKHAFRGVLGVATADAIFFALSATGIASLILASNLLFSAIKWFGVAYLLYLGVSILFGHSDAIRLDNKMDCGGVSRLYYRGLAVQLANPKALLYFSALLPQFIDSSKPILFQILVMGVSCLLADILVYSLYSRLGNGLARQGHRKWVISAINKVAGMTLIYTGIRMASLEYRG